MGFFATLAARLTLDGTNFKAGVKEAERVTRNFGQDIIGELKGQIAAAFGAAALISFANHVKESALRIKDLSEQWQITTDQVQIYEHATKKSGQGIDFLLSKMDKLDQMRKKAGEHPFGDEAEALRKLGLTAEEIQSPTLEVSDLLERIAERYQSGQVTGNDLFEVFGKSATKLMTILEDLKKAKEDTASVPMISQENIEAIDKASKLAEKAQDRLVAGAGNWLGESLRNPLKLARDFLIPGAIAGRIGTMGTGQGQVKPKEGAAPAPGTAEFIGPTQPNKPRFEDKDALDQYHATQQAEANLANAIFKIELQRASNMDKINILERSKVKLLEEELYWKNQIDRAEGETQKNAAREEFAKARQRRMEREQEIFDLRKQSMQDRPKLTENQGILTGGNIQLAKYYQALGAMNVTSDTPKQQLKVQEKQLNKLDEMAGYLRPKPGKTANF